MAEAGLKSRAIVAVLGVALLLAAWWWLSLGLPSYVLPSPQGAFLAAARFLCEPDLAWHALVSLVRVAASVAIALLLALGLGSLVRAFPLLEDIVERRILTFLSSVPSVGWAILGVIWFQISTTTVVFIQVVIVLPFALVNVLAGYRQLDPELDELGRSLTRHPLRRFRLLTLPLLLPFLTAGLRISFGICWKIALVSELFGAQSGLGYQLMQAQRIADANMVFGCCLVIVFIYGGMDRLLMRPLERLSAN